MLPQVIDLPLRHCHSDVLRYLGYRPDKTELNSTVKDLLEQCQRSFQVIAKPRGVYRSGELKELALENYWGSRDLERLLGTATRATLLAVTLGPEVDAQIDRLFASGDYAQAVVWDALGSDAAEQAMQSLYELVKREAYQQGFVLTARFSPGYGDLALQQQPRLHQLVSGAAIGIAVTPKHLLLPRKSATAIAGWLSTDVAKPDSRSNWACATCALHSCQYRCRGSNEEVSDETR